MPAFSDPLTTYATIAELQFLRSRVCTCGRQYMTPALHKLDCPYFGQGEDYLRMVLEEDKAKGGEKP